jgi:hypothetical protein
MLSRETTLRTFIDEVDLVMAELVTGGAVDSAGLPLPALAGRGWG